MKMYRMKDGPYINPQFITNLKITAEAKDRGYIVRVVAYLANQTKPVTLFSKRVDASADHGVKIIDHGLVCWTDFVPLPGPKFQTSLNRSRFILLIPVRSVARIVSAPAGRLWTQKRR